MALETKELSSAIISFAGAARTAQKLMSSGEYPMAIKEYSFEVNFTTDFEMKSETDVTCNMWGINLQEKLTLDYKEHMGITIKCTIVPGVTLGSSSGGGLGSSGD